VEVALGRRVDVLRVDGVRGAVEADRRGGRLVGGVAGRVPLRARRGLVRGGIVRGQARLAEGRVCHYVPIFI
jgi:hypothetical protein